MMEEMEIKREREELISKLSNCGIEDRNLRTIFEEGNKLSFSNSTIASQSSFKDRTHRRARPLVDQDSLKKQYLLTQQ